MTQVYKGDKIPRWLPKQLRNLLSDHDRLLALVEQQQPKLGGPGTSSTVPSTRTAGPGVSYGVDPSSGNVSTLPVAPAGTIASRRFTGGATLVEGGNLRLAGPQFAAGGVIPFVSDGAQWWELARPGPATFIPVRNWGARPDTGADMTDEVQTALDNMVKGTLAFEPGTYIVNGTSVTRNDISIYLPPGCILTTDTAASTDKAVFDVVGTIDTTTTKDVVVGPAPDAAYPRGGERTIFVAAGDEASFPADSWLSIEDTETVPGGLSSDPTYELEHHMEIVRVKATSSGRIDLYSPLVNSYTNVGGTPPKLRTVVPVQNFSIWGGGTIRNPTTPTGGTSHGIRLFNAIGAIIENISFEQCFNSGVHLARAQEVRIGKCEFRDAVRFDSRGYGITTYGGIRVAIVGNIFKRLRHCADISFFSRVVAVDGNSMIGSTTGNVTTHPCVEGLTITGNVIDGGHGQDAVSPSTEYGDSTAQAAGINIDQNNKSVAIVGNIIRNMRMSGIYIDCGASGFPTEFVTITGNTIENCCTYRRISPGSITNHAGISVTENSVGGTARRGIVIADNILREPAQYGILVGIDNVLVQGNWIYKAEDKMRAGVSPVVGIGIWVRALSSGIPTGIVVKNNLCHSCTQDGIRVGVNAGVAVASPIIEGNQCISNGINGIFLEEVVTTPLIKNNLCQSNADDGIDVQSAGGWVIGNRLASNTGFGLRFITGANNNLYKDNLLSGNIAGAVSDGGTSNFPVWIDDTNDRLGVGTNAPAVKFDILDTATQLRLTHTAGSRFTDLIGHDDATYGGLSLQPASNASALKVTTLFGLTESTGLTFLDDGSNLDMRTLAARNMRLFVASGQTIELSINFGAQTVQLQPTRFFTTVPIEAQITDAAFNSVSYAASYNHTTTGTAAPGIGAGIVFGLENGSGTTVTAGAWDCIATDVTAGAIDTLFRFRVQQNSSYLDELFVIRGDTGYVVVNEGGVSGLGLRVEASGQANLLFTDGTNARIGVRTGSPSVTMDVNMASGVFRVQSDTQANMLRVEADQVGIAGVPTDGFHVQTTTTFASGIRYSRVSTSTDLLLNTTHYYVAVDSSGGARIITLPATDGTGILAGKMYYIKRNGANTVTINPNGSNTIDGAASRTLGSDNDIVILVSNGGSGAAGDWEIGSDSIAGGGGGGDNIQVNGAAATDANFNDTTPSAPAGSGTNVKWQMSGAGPSSVSAYVPGNQGTAVLNFGAFPGASDASVAVTGQTGIVAGSVVQAWMRPVDTADHLADEHWVETIEVSAGAIVAGTGFTIFGRNSNQINEGLEHAGVGNFRSAATTVYGRPGDESRGGQGTRIYGQWNVQWRWN